MINERNKWPVRAYVFSTWASGVEDSEEYLKNLPTRDIRSMVIRPDDAELVKLGKLNCDWEGENLRAFAAMQYPGVEFLPARMTGTNGISELLKESVPEGEDRWIFFIAQQPAIHRAVIEKLMRHLDARGYRIFYWAFDEASRNMECFQKIAPYISVLIHDETPLDPQGEASLRKNCLKLHMSWVANVIPFSTPFREKVEDKIVFLGSKKGLTEHRVRQLAFLQEKFGEKFHAYCDHSVSIAERESFSHYKVHFCPEGGHFTTQGMSQTHTDRPFWAGCMGQVPIVENSKWGNRLEKEFQEEMIVRYDYQNLKSLENACRQALECSIEKRKKIYNYFNQWGTIAPVAAKQIAIFRSQF